MCLMSIKCALIGKVTIVRIVQSSQKVQRFSYARQINSGDLIEHSDYSLQ